MYYKLSNSASLNVIEFSMDAKFRFPDVYKTSPIIDGLNEELLPVITNEKPETLEFAIWGMLPDNFRDEWSVFQKIRNTLNIDVRAINAHSDYKVALQERRCVVVVSGFFASYNYQGQVYPIYVYPEGDKVFSLAAIYNITFDGFITFSILLENSNYLMSKLHNISDSMPIVLDESHKDIWLGENYNTIIMGYNNSFEKLNFTSHTIAKEFYKNNILYDSILEPATYKDLIINS
ncbi:SOS response-associated peptidase family protein [uncultured Psychroserpens sp.]|uniref:SOS response-associated peptidase family protein n=1 Tax=uncultured Psychroserpens sp. TaxID=255436 RepID=UPI0026174116|nr:SOS response-associated peptidase family protein [uncultured Psychroserpens sp.]